MKFSKITIAPKFLFLIFFAITIIIACSKDGDEPHNAVDEVSAASDTDDKAVKLSAKETETLSTSFSPIQDAYIQSGKGYDQKIVRLEDGRRKSYLMFDLRKIESNGGSLLSVDLEFSISSDGGDGTISVFKGKAGDWSEENLSASSAPVSEVLLASTTDQYKIGQTKSIRLDSKMLSPGLITLVMTHEDGNDLAFASKEHPDEEGPKLIVTYKAPTVTDSTIDNEPKEEKEEELNNENKPIAAVIYGSIPPSVQAPLTIDFKAWNSKNQKDITSYFWDFKDGSTTTKKNPAHTFTKSGEYTVELTVKNAAGFTDTATFDITVTASSSNNDESGIGGNSEENAGSASGNASLNFAAVISGSIPTNAQAPTSVDFKAWNSKNQKDITGYFWDFNDGSTTTKKNPSHTFTEPGNYTVELSVKNAAGQTHSTTRNISITGSSTSNSGNGSSSNGGSSGGSEGSGGSGGNGNNTSSGGTNSGEGSSGGSTSGNYPSNAVFASSYGFKSGDATTAFKAAINSGSSYVVIDKQSSDWVIQPTKFFNLRNMTIVFEPGVVLRAKSGAFGARNAQLVNLATPDNLTIEGTGATFKMNKSEYNSGEFRHTLGISGGKNINIKGLTLKDSGGDGIFISVSSSRGYSENITIDGVTCENNRRQGMTIVSGKDIFVKNSRFLNSSGTKPGAGVDLESERTTDRLQNINFTNCEFSGNDNAGFHFSSVHVNSSSPAIDVTVSDSEFKNNGVSPSGGGTPTEIYLGGGQGTNPVNGEIRFERVKFNGSRGRIIFTRKSAKGFKAVFKDCEARNVVTSSSRSPIRLEAHENRNTLGGIVFDNFYIEYSRNVPFMHINAPSKGGSFDVANVSGSFTIKEPNDNPLKYSGGYRSDKNVNVSISYNHN